MKNGKLNEVEPMPGAHNYVKIWTKIFNDEWFISLPGGAKGFWLWLLVYAKHVGDTGLICCRSVRALSTECQHSVQTVNNYLSLFRQSGKIEIKKRDKYQFTIDILNYPYYQELTPVKRKNKGAAKRSKTNEKVTINRTTTRQDKTRQDKTSGVQKNSAHKEAINYFCQLYKNHYGIKYDFKQAKDGKLIKHLLQAWGLEHLCLLIDQLFKSTDDFYESGGGRSIGILSANSNKLAQEIIRGQNGLAGMTKLERKNAVAIATWLKKHGELNAGTGQDGVCAEPIQISEHVPKHGNIGNED